MRRRSHNDHSSPAAKGTTRPILGMVTQSTESPEMDAYCKEYSHYLAASFVRWVESSGARVVPIHYDVDEKELRHLFESVNGIVLTGGEIEDIQNTQYGKTATRLFEWAKKANDSGDHFPIFGTCQGLQLLCQMSANNYEIEEHCVSCAGVSKPLNFTEKAHTSRFFSLLPPKLYNYLATHPASEHFHHKCIPLHAVNENPGLRDMFDVLVVAHDLDGKEFVSCLEGKRYPIYISQFHPERSAWEWDVNEQIDHSAEAILAMQHLGVFLTSEARKSNHCFADPEEEHKRLIYASPAELVDTSQSVKVFTQVYLWKHGDAGPGRY